MKEVTINELQEKIDKIWNDQFIILEDNKTFKYQGVHSHIMVKCTKCGTKYKKRINDLLHGYGCNNCSKLKRRTNEEWKEKVEEITNGEYSLVSNHCRTRDKAIFRHNSKTCLNPNNKKEFTKTIHNFVNLGQRCPFCSKFSKDIRDSKGILKIKKFLDSKNIKYIAEYRIKECISESGHMLPFDLYLPDYNILIEYDGEQHFKPIEIFGGEDQYEKLKHNDKIKNNFSKESNYSLLRISYKEFNKINNILNEYLDKFI